MFSRVGGLACLALFLSALLSPLPANAVEGTAKPMTQMPKMRSQIRFIPNAFRLLAIVVISNQRAQSPNSLAGVDPSPGLIALDPAN